MLQQLTMFDVPANSEISFDIFHDESGTYVLNGGDRWLLHGVLFIPEMKKINAYSALQDARRDTKYQAEVHFSKLRNHVKGPKTNCAKAWLNLYTRQLSGFCFYHCLAIDTHSPAFKQNSCEAYLVYNRFARMALEGGIAWCLKKYRRIAIKFYSDGKRRGNGDNFTQYILRETCSSISCKRQESPNKYPEIRMKDPEAICITSNPGEATIDIRQECEFIQLVDLITSSIAEALTCNSDQKAKIGLAQIVGRWIDDVRKPPWLQTAELHRRFSLTCFPDENGNFYTPSVPILNKNQPGLFEGLVYTDPFNYPSQGNQNNGITQDMND
jgi:hypothetical protein